jgi:hypothetical protein
MTAKVCPTSEGATLPIIDCNQLKAVIRHEDDLLAAAGGSAPEGGTASSASAKVPRGRLAPRRSRTPTRGGIKRHGACTGF